MWEYEWSGQLYVERALEFVKSLTDRWERNKSHHETTIVLFSRVYYERGVTKRNFPAHAQNLLAFNEEGLLYEDFYRVIVQDEKSTDYTALLLTLKREFIAYPHWIRSANVHPPSNIAAPPTPTKTPCPSALV